MFFFFFFAVSSMWLDWLDKRSILDRLDGLYVSDKRSEVITGVVLLAIPTLPCNPKGVWSLLNRGWIVLITIGH